ncbi:MAG: hypothetical protein WA056_01655 [Gallionella sp.]
MARARNIKPGFFKNETLAECSPLSRLLFAGLWCIADRAGRLEDRPKRIRAEILPYDDGSVDDMLDELHQAGFILRYQVGEQRFIQVLNFSKHQNPHCRESESTIPAPVEHSACTVQEQDEHRTGPADSLNLIPDSLNPITATPPSGDPLVCPVEEIIALYHEAMPTNPRCKVTNQARKGAIKARWLEASRLTCKPFGYRTREDGLAAWRAFFETCNESLFLTGRAAAQQGKPPFVADIDFLVSPGGFAKCLENKYHREAA